MLINETITSTTTCTLKEFEVLDGTLTQKIFIRVTPIIVCVGLLGNILSVCVFILTDLKRQSVSILTIALALTDSLVLLIPVSLVWLGTVLKRDLTDVSAFWCRTHGFFDLTFTCSSSWLMVCIAFERFCAVWLPHNNKTLFTHRKTFFLAVIIILSSTLMSTWFLFAVKMIPKTRIHNPNPDLITSTTGITPFRYASEPVITWQAASENHTIVHYQTCDLNDDSLYDNMGMVSVVMNYFLPFIFVFLLNSTIIYRLCMRGIVELTSSITVTLTLVCLVHLVCTLPFQCWWIVFEVADQTGDCLWLENKLSWRTITFTIRNLNYMANFFLYSCSSKLFRDELQNMILLCLLPHQKYQNYHYRRQSLYDNMAQQRVSITQMIMRRLSRTTEYTNGGGGGGGGGGTGAV